MGGVGGGGLKWARLLGGAGRVQAGGPTPRAARAVLRRARRCSPGRDSCRVAPLYTLPNAPRPSSSPRVTPSMGPKLQGGWGGWDEAQVRAGLSAGMGVQLNAARRPTSQPASRAVTALCRATAGLTACAASGSAGRRRCRRSTAAGGRSASPGRRLARTRGGPRRSPARGPCEQGRPCCLVFASPKQTASDAPNHPLHACLLPLLPLRGGGCGARGRLLPQPPALRSPARCPPRPRPSWACRRRLSWAAPLPSDTSRP